MQAQDGHNAYSTKDTVVEVGERQIQHKAKPSAIFHLEITLQVLYLMYSMSLGSALTVMENCQLEVHIKCRKITRNSRISLEIKDFGKSALVSHFTTQTFMIKIRHSKLWYTDQSYND